jgi:hypothetical protein
MALALLRNRLADSEARTTDATIASVISLCLMSDRFGDVESTRKHMQGLFDMIQLRGGIQGFQNDPQLQVKICRYVVYTSTSQSPGRSNTSSEP